METWPIVAILFGLFEAGSDFLWSLAVEQRKGQQEQQNDEWEAGCRFDEG